MVPWDEPGVSLRVDLRHVDVGLGCEEFEEVRTNHLQKKVHRSGFTFARGDGIDERLVVHKHKKSRMAPK